jgi:protein TonB
MIMLRLSFFLSACLHIVLLGVVSVIVSQHPTHELQTEKRFRINLQKNVVTTAAASSSVTSSGQPESETRLKRSARLLPPSQEFSRTQSPLQKAQQRKPVKIQPLVPMPSQVLRKPSPNIQTTRMMTPKIQEFVAKARDFPTPMPAKPTPVQAKPTPILTVPNRVSASLPETKAQLQPVETPDISTPSAIIPPASSPQVGFAPTNYKDTGGDTVKEPEPQKTLLNRYLQEVTAKINAVKQYPRRARKEGWEGTVVIKLQILPTGKVETMVLAEKSPYEILNEAALQAITKAQPFPKFYRGLTLRAITVNVPIQFTLEKR